MDNVPPTPPPPFVPPGAPNPGQPYPGQAYPGQPPGQPYPGQQYPGQPPQKGWFGRNCLWFVPVGCLSLLLIVALFVGGIFFFVFGLLKSSDVYKTAVERAKTNPQVVNALGSPVDVGFALSGSIHTTGDAGDADLSIPVAGSKGKGTIFVIAAKSGGVWHYSKMNVHVDATNEDIDLNQSSP